MNRLKFAVTLATVAAAATTARAASVIHYWDFDTLSGGAPVDVVLVENAVNYAVKSQSVTPLKFGDRARISTASASIQL